MTTEVSQEDREAAANWCEAQPFLSKLAEAPMIRCGEYDHHSLVQALARYRIEALARQARPASDGLVERLRAWSLYSYHETHQPTARELFAEAATRIAELEAALSSSREAVLEEAAKVADGYYAEKSWSIRNHAGNQIAADIRALKEAP